VSALAVALRGEVEVVDAGALAAAADEFARTRASLSTRATCASVYRSFAAFLGPGARIEDPTPTAVLRYREYLEQRGFKASTVAKQLAAIRQLAMALGVQGVGRVRAQRVPRGQPRPLSGEDYGKLLRMPDAGQARPRAAAPAGHGRAAPPGGGRRGDRRHRRASTRGRGRLRRAIHGSTSYWVTVRDGKRGNVRAVPLEDEALTAIEDWYHARPECAVDQLLVSLPRRRQESHALGVRDVGRIVGHYGALAGLPERLRTLPTLRHTFCSHLVESGVRIEVVKELAGHADISTTQIHTAVSDHRLEDAIELGARRRRGGLGSSAGS